LTTVIYQTFDEHPHFLEQHFLVKLLAKINNGNDQWENNPCCRDSKLKRPMPPEISKQLD
jgi:hypothetical protein